MEKSFRIITSFENISKYILIRRSKTLDENLKEAFLDLKSGSFRVYIANTKIIIDRNDELKEEDQIEIMRKQDAFTMEIELAQTISLGVLPEKARNNQEQSAVHVKKVIFKDCQNESDQVAKNKPIPSETQVQSSALNISMTEEEISKVLNGCNDYSQCGLKKAINI